MMLSSSKETIVAIRYNVRQFYFYYKMLNCLQWNMAHSLLCSSLNETAAKYEDRPIEKKNTSKLISSFLLNWDLRMHLHAIQVKLVEDI